MSTFALEVSDVVKRYPRRRSLPELVRREVPAYTEALSGLSFTVRPGELVGLLGPNGAGKTTLLKTLSGLMLPDEGSVSVLGLPSSSRRIPDRLGLANGDERSFYWRLTARENLDFFARLHGLTGLARKQRVAQLLEQVELPEQADRRFSDLSAGMKQRLAIARGILADPEVLLMDEPTRSLDPVHVDHLITWVKDRLHHEMGKSILLATHDLHVAERICDRVLVLQQGRILLDGSPADLRTRGLTDRLYSVQIRGPVPGSIPHAAILGCEPSGAEQQELRIRLEVDAPLQWVLDAVSSAGGQVLDCVRETGEIEDGFMKLVGSENTAGTEGA